MTDRTTVRTRPTRPDVVSRSNTTYPLGDLYFTDSPFDKSAIGMSDYTVLV